MLKNRKRFIFADNSNLKNIEQDQDTKCYWNCFVVGRHSEFVRVAESCVREGVCVLYRVWIVCERGCMCVQ